MERYKNFIDGKFVEPLTKKYYQNINPGDYTDCIGEFPCSGKEDVDNAVKAARKAFASWGTMPPPKRADLIIVLANKLRENRNKIAEIIVREMGKTLPGALGEMNSAIEAADFAAGEGRRMYGQTSFSALNKRWVLTKRIPIGVSGLITAWNAPLAIISWKLFPAIICGNTVVLKPSEDTPMTAQIFAELVKESGIPDGVINVVHGVGDETGSALIENKGVDLMSFTGSSEVGAIISREYGSRMKQCSLEMGGKNGLLVMDDADLDVAADAVIAGAFSCSGQRCAATSRLIIQENMYDEMLKKVIERTKQLKIGPGTDPDNFVHPIINKKQLKDIKAKIDTAIADGAKLIIGGNILTKGIYEKGNYVEPTIFVDVDPMSKLAQEEIFGPVLAVFKCKDFDEGIDLMNSTEYGLTASIHTKNINMALEAMERIEAGCCYVNAPTFGSEAHIPFGGVKNSGNGHREPGTQALDVFSEWKTIYFDYSQVSQNSQFSMKPLK